MTKKYIAIGFWKYMRNMELPHPLSFQNKEIGSEEKEMLIQYLKKSKRIAWLRGFEKCLICQESLISGNFATDGEFYFPGDLTEHYVRKHNVELPKEFINKILNNLKQSEIDRTKLFKNDSLIDKNVETYHVDYSWWIHQKGTNDLFDEKKYEEEKKTAAEILENTFIYKDGTKKIETDTEIKMIFPDGEIKIFKK